MVAPCKNSFSALLLAFLELSYLDEAPWSPEVEQGMVSVTLMLKEKGIHILAMYTAAHKVLL